MADERPPLIFTPDQRLRVFISSARDDLGPERAAARQAVASMHLTPVMLETAGASEAVRSLYNSYLEQSHVFVGVYWQSYGEVGPGASTSEIELEYERARDLPKLIYIKEPAPDIDPRLKALTRRLVDESDVSFKRFTSAEELQRLIQEDLALMLTERFDSAGRSGTRPVRDDDALHRLPLEGSALVGRDAEIDRITGALSAPDVRLVTLTGPGGIGKTRLGVEIARRLQAQLPDGVRFVPLAGLSDPGAVPAFLAQALAVREEDPAAVFDAVLTELSESEMLIVLDNFEQIMGAAPLVAQLLMAAPKVKVLVTSREPLRLRGEVDIDVPPLSLPEGRDLASVGDNEAVRLFLERARAVDPRVELTEETAPIFAEICHRLDGLPLAIELAAARMKVLTPQALLDRLDSRLRLLTSGPRDLPERQQTLRDTIDWSHELLDRDERTVFARLAVFAGARSLEAIEAICDPGEDLDVLTLVSSLLDKSLLRRMPMRDGEPRFIMLHTIHEYALEKLAESGELEDMRARHGNFYTELVERAHEGLRSPHQLEWLEALDLDYANIRQALAWSDHNSAPHLLRLVYAMWRFWSLRAYFTDALHYAERAMTRGTAADESLRAPALWGAGNVFAAVGQAARARAVFEEALALCRELDDRDGVATVLKSLGILAANASDLAGAQPLWEESLAIFREIGDEVGVAQVLNNLGVAARHTGDTSRAIDLLHEANDRFAALDDEEGVARALVNLGAIHRDIGRHDEADAYLRRATELWGQIGAKWDLVDCFEDWAALEAARERYPDAARYFGAAAALRDELGTSAMDLDLAVFKPLIERVTERLGPEEWRRQWTLGYEMSLEMSINHIVRGDPLATG